MKKNILITGATSGIGYATAKGLIEKGHRLIITGRERLKAENAKSELEKIAKDAKVDYLLADMSDAHSVLELVKQIHSKIEKLDVLINNAGLLSDEKKITKDGFEAHLAINHIMPALLANELKPLLQKSNDARVVFLTTGGHHFGKIDFDDLQSEKSFYAFKAYGSSKLMHLMWNYSIAEEWHKEGVKVYAADPGGAKTNMTDAMSSNYLPFPFKLLFPLMKLTVGGSVEKAAKSSIYLSTSDEVKDKTALYVNHKMKIVKSSKKSYDKEIQKKVKGKTKQWLEKIKSRYHNMYKINSGLDVNQNRCCH